MLSNTHKQENLVTHAGCLKLCYPHLASSDDQLRLSITIPLTITSQIIVTFLQVLNNAVRFPIQLQSHLFKLRERACIDCTAIHGALMVGREHKF